MSRGIPAYAVRKATSMIKGCKSIEELERLKNQLITDIDKYQLSDQGFLMTMMGIQICKITDQSTPVDSIHAASILTYRNYSDN